MTEPVLVTRLERALARAWPAAEVDRMDGWELRAAGGHTRRANSVNPFSPHPADLVAAVGKCERWYRERALRPVFRLTPISNPAGLDDRLASMGYAEDGGTWVMVGSIPDGAAVETTRSPSETWLAARGAWSALSAEYEAAWKGILRRISGDSVGFGLVATPTGVPAAIGHAVVDGDLVGLYGLIVDPRLRRRGHGERLSRGLLAWGRERGATTAYLQVHEPTSAPAMAMYEGKFGMGRAYEYRYRQAANRQDAPG
ncbi:MAG: GNAT family N-acetyltransferase [Acidimicrobiia bacterium]|nr:GNAT family N-acetyltransferase [Acidimicrobiia bacterium]